MPEATDQLGVGRVIAVRCEACGARFRARSWREGLTCPECRGGRVKPAVAPGGAVDYYVADRSEGYARADLRFAQWAKWTGLITPYQYEVAFIKQKRAIEAGREPSPIHEVFIEEGALGEKQSLGLLEFMGLPRPDEDDGEFASILLGGSQVDREKLRKVQALQVEIARKRNEVPPLCQLMLERRVISEGRMLAVLSVQERKGRGALRAAKMMASGPKRQSSLRGVPKALSVRNSRLRSGALIVVLFAAALGLWWWQTREEARTAYVICEACHTISEVPWSKTYPLKCPKCGRELAYHARMCPKGHVYGAGSPYVPATCPRCGLTRSRPLTARDVR